MDLENFKQTVFLTLSQTQKSFLNARDKTVLEAGIHAHEDLLQYLTQHISTLKNHRNSLSLVSKLPMEVLSEIMLVATQEYIKDNNDADVYPITLPLPLVLGHVCAAWRTLAWQLPALWSTIPLALSKPFYERQVVLLEEWLARAGEHQDLYIVLTLRSDHAELAYWRDYPPKEVLSKLYKRSMQWHTFYSTLPNLCFDMFAVVYERLPRLHTLILNRSGRVAYEVFINGVMNNFVGTQGHHPFLHGGAPHPAQPGAPAPTVPLTAILDTEYTRTHPWHMLSKTPSLRTVVLPEALTPLDITLTWSQLTHLEVRTIPIDDCFRVLEQTPQIISFDFYGIYSGPLTFFPTPNLQLLQLQKFNIFSDPANISRFLDALTAPKLFSVEFKSTTGTLSIITSQLVQLTARSGCRLTRLGLCIPCVGKSEEQIVGFLMGEEMRELEEIILESWQADVEGLSDQFLERMNPERRVKSVRSYSYPLPNGQELTQEGGSSTEGIIVSDGWVDVPTDEVREVQDLEVEVADVTDDDDVVDDGGGGSGGSGANQGNIVVLLPNLLAMTYKGTISFKLRTLRDMLLARWKRKPRKRMVPKFHYLRNNPGHVPPLSPLETYLNGIGTVEEEEDGGDGGDQRSQINESTIQTISYEEEEWFPTSQLTGFEIYDPETELKEPIDEETNLAFRRLLTEGFCLSITTKRGPLAF